ncbi:gas vesicle protein GvpO [Yaniella halotolerans]|uniref:gas vesicle protein GvpO n=1 Tax=Yaniella halotolerans TaxID=225453 RepID=UPI0003B6007C|nr:gas vesicle protein GvpO [Yaniella halotolerans]
MTEQQAHESDEKTTRQRRPSSSNERESTTQKRPQRKSAERSAESTERSSTSAKKRKPVKPQLSARKAAAAALKQLQELTTRTPESVTGVEPRGSGWRVTVEVIESARIPDTADIMAEYDVDIDGSGELAGYARGARYFRGRTRDE